MRLLPKQVRIRNQFRAFFIKTHKRLFLKPKAFLDFNEMLMLMNYVKDNIKLTIKISKEAHQIQFNIEFEKEFRFLRKCAFKENEPVCAKTPN